MKTNATIINATPNKNLIINKIQKSFEKGMLNVGVKTYPINLRELNIQPCRGCTNKIDFRSTKICKINDSMQSLYSILQDSEIWVFITQLIDTEISNKFYNFLDRLEPLFQPNYKTINQTDIYLKSINTTGKIILISLDNNEIINKTEIISKQLKMIADIFDKKILSTIFYNQLALLEFSYGINNTQTNNNSNMFEIFELAGQQAIKQNNFSKEILQLISITSETKKRNSKKNY